MSNAIATKPETTEVELTDEQLTAIVGGYGCEGRCEDYNNDDNCGDSYEYQGHHRRRRHHGGCGEYGWGRSSYESDYSEERHTHRSYSSCY